MNSNNVEKFQKRWEEVNSIAALSVRKVVEFCGDVCAAVKDDGQFHDFFLDELLVTCSQTRSRYLRLGKAAPSFPVKFWARLGHCDQDRIVATVANYKPRGQRAILKLAMEMQGRITHSRVATIASKLGHEKKHVGRQATPIVYARLMTVSAFLAEILENYDLPGVSIPDDVVEAMAKDARVITEEA